MEAKRAVQFEPNSASANLALAAVCFFANRSSEGLESVDRAIRFSPKDPRHYSHLLTKGAILCEIGRAEEGIELLKQAVSIPHGDYRPALFLACYSAEIGSIDEAQKAAARLLELNPDFTLTLFETKLSGHFHPDLKQRTINHLNRLDLPK